MPQQNGNANNGQVDIGSWIVTIIMLFIFWPVGIFMLINRLREAARAANVSRPASRTTYTAPQKTQQEAQSESPLQQAAEQKKSTRKEAKAGKIKQQQTDHFAAQAYKQLAKEQRTSKTASVILLLIGIITVLVGGSISISALSGMLNDYWYSVSDLVIGTFFALGGGALLYVRQFLPRRTKLRRRYLAVIGERMSITLAELSMSLGRTEVKVQNELQDMIDDGYFGAGAYIDNSLGMLVIDSSAVSGRQEFRTATKEETKASISEYDRIIRELRTLDEKIEDASISYKIERIEATSAKIFSAVQENPEKLPQIRRFMNYYLPTTLKLLRSYATLEKQGIGGENIASTKDSINNVLSKLATGFDQQLDQLFRVDAMDIGSDIDVLENMMAQDGLSASGPLSQTSSGDLF